MASRPSASAVRGEPDDRLDLARQVAGWEGPSCFSMASRGEGLSLQLKAFTFKKVVESRAANDNDFRSLAAA